MTSPAPAELEGFTGWSFADSRKLYPDSPAERSAYMRGHSDGRDSGRLSEAFKGEAEPERPTLPRLTARNVPRYIAAVANALNLGKLTPAESNALLYAAQMLVAAHRAIGDIAPAVPKEKRIRVIQAAADAVASQVQQPAVL